MRETFASSRHLNSMAQYKRAARPKSTPTIKILKGTGWQYIIRRNVSESSHSDQEENQ